MLHWFQVCTIAIQQLCTLRCVHHRVATTCPHTLLQYH